MATPKYKKQYQEMIKYNKALFDSLKDTDRKTEEFRDIQKKVLRVIGQNENLLCSKTETTRYSSFSTNLSDMFWKEIRADYPEVDFS